MYQFKFADIGEGLHEGTVGKIYVKVGDKIAEGDSLFSVETDKVTSDIPAPVTGKIAKIMIKTGATVHVGDVTMHIDDGSGAAVVEEKVTPVAPKKQPSSDDNASVVGDIKVSDAPLNTNFKAQQPSSTRPDGAPLLATPYARKLAATKGLAIAQIPGSGYNGRVLARDVESFQGHATMGTGPALTSGPVPYHEAVTPMRKAIAKAMKNSWANVAYTNLTNEVNMTKLWDERKVLVQHVLAKYKVKISFTALIAIATVQALRKFPVLNAKYDEQAQVIKHDGVINLGIAVDTPKGLVVPTIKHAETKNIVEIAMAIQELATKARAGKLTGADMAGGTFTITNYGSAGAMWGVPVINYPELAILGIGTIVDRIFAHDNGSFYSGKMMNLTVAGDHRWIDGATIGKFISYIKELLENPILLLGGF